MTNSSTSSANTLFPGLHNYKGKTKGFFTLPHHKEHLIEWSYNIIERIDYINREKSKGEREIRLRHIVYVPASLIPMKFQKARGAYYRARGACDKARAAWDRAWEAYGRAREAYDRAMADYDKARAACDKNKTLLKYLHKNVPDCKWNGKEIVFTPSL